jgi:hypothetical protein
MRAHIVTAPYEFPLGGELASRTHDFKRTVVTIDSTAAVTGVDPKWVRREMRQVTNAVEKVRTKQGERGKREEVRSARERDRRWRESQRRKNRAAREQAL